MRVPTVCESACGTEIHSRSFYEKPPAPMRGRKRGLSLVRNAQVVFSDTRIQAPTSFNVPERSVTLVARVDFQWRRK